MESPTYSEEKERGERVVGERDQHRGSEWDVK